MYTSGAVVFQAIEGFHKIGQRLIIVLLVLNELLQFESNGCSIVQTKKLISKGNINTVVPCLLGGHVRIVDSISTRGYSLLNIFQIRGLLNNKNY